MSQWRLPGAVDDRHTFFAHALALAAAHGPGPWPDGGYPLPDEESPPVMSGSVHDGIRTHHFAVNDGTQAAVKIAEAISAIVESPPDLVAVQRLHDLIAEHDTLTIADPLTDRLLGADRDRVREVGRWLAEYGTRRDAVATGIVLIGLTGDERDRELLLLLGSMEDLALYAVVALGRTQSDRDMAIFELARRVRAWGRIQAVERLEGTTDPEIKAWLLREGFRNGVMNEYLAYIAATTGGLADALTESEVDDEVLDAAGDILAALSDVGGPAKDIRSYPEGHAMIDRYLAVVRHRPSVSRIRAVLQLDQYLEDGRCEQLLTDLAWIGVVRRALDSADLDTFTDALWPAKQIGLKTADRIAAWLERYPCEWGLWIWFRDAEDAVKTAERLLPLEDLVTGPALEHGFGPEFQADRALGLVVEREDVRSWPLVKTALSNRLIRNRIAAVRALKAWPRDSLPADALPAVRAAAAIEPDNEIKSALTELLAA
ncbi:hypothetical protein [Kibdelosporangium aridum]|uniref:Limonene hydroxylase n=1 Tax=Kibdelosporangium aridum TaxID=2030 RepID=A0A1W2FHF5_KIBAR|nr:hypothetical protein [Kibdelosporangium aridum]SMD21116.1 hypothetical protein SAMN05661093_06740 [Kibdelosporangium aridum]